jgi:hypothetical protein
VDGAEGVTPGSFIEVTLDEVVEDVDFAATYVRTVSAPSAKSRQARSLPVMSASVSIGSFGR